MIKCAVCGKEFEKEISFRSHKRIHSPLFLESVERIKEKNSENYKRRLQSLKDKYYASPKTCSVCQNVIPFEGRLNKFCSQSCAATNSNREREPICYSETRICTRCNGEFTIDSRANKKVLCLKCRETEEKRCHVCGQSPCLSEDVCSHYGMFRSLVKFGLDLSKKGTLGIIDDFERVRDFIEEEYVEKRLSVEELKIKYGFANNETCRKILESLGIKRRSLSEAVSLDIEKNGIKHKRSDRYLYGWHRDWAGKDHFYRSSYELDFYKKLDEERVEYETESLRIRYFDTAKNRERIAVPDIVIMGRMQIIEIKGDFTYDEQNMVDKFRAYKEKGFSGYVLLNKAVRIDF